MFCWRVFFYCSCQIFSFSFLYSLWKITKIFCRWHFVFLFCFFVFSRNGRKEAIVLFALFRWFLVHVIWFSMVTLPRLHKPAPAAFMKVFVAGIGASYQKADKLAKTQVKFEWRGQHFGTRKSVKVVLYIWNAARTSFLCSFYLLNPHQCDLLWNYLSTIGFK